MKHRRALSPFFVCLVSTCVLAASAGAQEQQAPKVQIPQPGVPQVMTMEGQYVRAAYNNEGYVILGYRVANNSVGGDWILLEIGATLRDGVKAYTLTRETPDGKTVPLATESEFRAANGLPALNMQANTIRDSINYFPPSATRACRIGFFSDLNTRAMAYDQVELSNTRACLGRVFFHVPDKIAYGQHWLNVQFRDSLVRVPFRILTKDEEKLLSKNYKSIEKQVEEAFKPKKK
jgi:hypothetical protein